MSSNEDYISINYVNSKYDVRPGLVPDRISKLNKRELKHKEHNQWQKQKSRKVLEEESRKQGLESAIGQDNKGFQLMQKMGYKPNTGIGRFGTGRLEPVPIDLKPSKGGVGLEEERKRRGDQIQKMRTEKKIKVEKEWKQSIKTKLNDKGISKDLIKSQKACEQLDFRKNIKEPLEKYYWPKEFLKSKEDKDSEIDDDDDDDDSNDEDNDDDDNELSKTDQLERLTEYLRTTYFYCIWCAIEFNDSDDMISNCPGKTSTDHDD